MVLESQRMRVGGSRGYVSSAKLRRRGRMRLIVGLVVVVLLVYLGFEMFGGEGDQTNANNAGASPGVTENNGSSGTSTASTGSQGTGAYNPLNQTNGHPLLGGSKTTGTTTGTPGTTTGGTTTGTTGTATTTTGTPGTTTTTTGSTVTPPPPPPPPVNHVDDSVATDAQVKAQIDRGRQLIQTGKLVEARRFLNSALHGRISGADAQDVRTELTKLNDVLIFSQRAVQNDPLVATHTVKSGDLLSTIAKPHNVPWPLVGRINQVDPRRLRIGKTLKIPKGPFHLVIVKHAFRADAYLESADGPVYIRSFRVGLGEDDSTPVGHFTVRRGSKLSNPKWVNPRTGKVYEPDDPTNPIGERWIGLAGADERTRQMSGYGLHGTIEPQSIGRQASMGCIRFHAKDIELVYDMLIGTKSRVVIKP